MMTNTKFLSGRVCVAVSLTISAMIPQLAPAGGPVISDEVKEHVRKRVDEGGTTGIILGLVDESGATFFAHGVAAIGGAKLDENTVFEIGSITKAFTGMLLADAVNQGSIKLDDPVSKYLPAGTVIPTKDDAAITVEHLATHRSGLPRMPTNFEPKNDDNPYVDYSPEQLLAGLKEITLSEKPGAKYDYSNLGAGFLGYVLAQKAGKSYDELVRERILAPAGMDSTACKLPESLQKRFANGHADGKPVPHWDLNESIVGAGGIRSSAKDMTRFLSACMGIGNESLKPVIAKALSVRYPTAIANTEIALGWHIDKEFGADGVWHNGGTGGFHSFCGFRMDKKLGVVVLTNSTDNIDDLGRYLLKSEFPFPKVQTFVRLKESELDAYVGYYQFAPGMLFHVTRDGGLLNVQMTGQSAIPVYPEGNDKFFCKAVKANLTFKRGDGGAVNAVVLHQNGMDQTAERLPPDKEPKPRTEVKVDATVLKDYVGKFTLAPSAVFDVRLGGDKLMVQLTGQPRFQVFAESETKFFYKVVDAQLTFVRDADGKVTSLILHQGGRDQTAKRTE